MVDQQLREEFDTGLSKIRHEIKSRLVTHGFFGTVTTVDVGADNGPAGSKIEILVNGRTAARLFDRRQIEDCHLRVGGPVLAGIISMVDELEHGGAPPA